MNSKTEVNLRQAEILLFESLKRSYSTTVLSHIRESKTKTRQIISKYIKKNWGKTFKLIFSKTYTFS